MRFWNKSLMARLVTYFLALSAIGVTVTTVITLAIVRNALTRSIYDRLEAVAILKEDELNRWVNDQRDEIAYLVVAPDLRADAQVLSSAEVDSAKYVAAHDSILELLVEEVESHPSFSEMFLMSSVGGKVLVSTEKGNEGQYRVSDSYYTQGRLDTYIQNVYPSPQTGQPAMTVSAPLRDAGGGNLLGVLALHVNLERLDSIILQRAGLGNTGETYIVDRFNNFISAARSGEREYPRGVHTQGIDTALRGEDGLAQYTNYGGVPVIGVFRWMDDRDMALLAEISQQEALAPIQRVAATILASGLAIAALLALGVYLISQQIARPLLAINAAANQMAAGSLNTRAPELTQDEIGTLAISFNAMAGQIHQLVNGLEQRVAERTAELRTASQQSEKRALDLQTISEISRAISSEQGLEKLLPLITKVVSERFGYYHVGIFLLDEAANFANLRAANSPGGQRMLERGHRLEIGQVGIVGKVASTSQPRIALNVGEDAVYFNNPDLPETRSEMALPMTVANKIIGVLDVQSLEPSAFTNEDVSTLSILADQIGIAIENARLLEATRRSLTEAETVYRQYMQREWLRFSAEQKLTGFRYANGSSDPLQVPVELGEIAHVMEDGKIHQKEAGGEQDLAQLAVPVKMRGEVIGLLNILMPGKQRWTDDDIDIIEAVAERVALSIENARLFQTTANRAERERVISNIASKISGNIRMENILQTTAQELSQALGSSDVLIQLQAPKQAPEEQA